jgi:hypothetical protein
MFRDEPMGVFLARLAILVAFACCLAAMAPHFWFVLSHPGAMYPPGQDYTLAAVPGVRYYRIRTADGRMMALVDFSGRTKVSGEVIQHDDKGSASGGD